MTDFGELKKRGLREIWQHEAISFTPWLARNIEALGDALGMELELAGEEVAVGDFSLDLLANDLGTGGKVIIENQLTPSDHDHLGKLITYAAGFGAEKVIWLAEILREEHRQALEWLNQRTDEETQFFAVTVEVLQIDNSRPAYDFKVLVMPNEWQKTAKRRRSAPGSDKGERYRDFYQRLIDELREKHHFTGARVGQPQNWYSFTSGHTGIRYGLVFTQGSKVRAELYIDLGDAEKNQQVFEYLEQRKQEIESDYGAPLSWERLDNRRASRVAIYRVGSIQDEGETLDSIHDWSVDELLRIKRVFSERVRSAVCML